MKSFEYSIQGPVAVVTMINGENRINNEFIDEFLSVLDEIENRTEAGALVVTSAHEKIFTNGLDLEWLAPLVEKGDHETVRNFLLHLMHLLKRILVFPAMTIAAINGHAFAGGAIMASAFDFRFMRSDRGYFCLPEVDLGIPLSPGMTAIMQKAVPMPQLVDMLLLARRFTAEECQAHGIVKEALPRDRVLSRSVEFAVENLKKRWNISAIKQITHRDIMRVIDEEDPVYIKTKNLGI